MQADSQPAVRTAQAARPLYLALGLLSVGIGFVNHFIPGMPSTVFYLIALWAFRRSSPKLEHWLLWKSPMGPVLRDWEDGRTMTHRNKVLAIAFVWIGILASVAYLVYASRPIWASGLLLLVAVSLTVFLLSVQTKREA